MLTGFCFSPNDFKYTASCEVSSGGVVFAFRGAAEPACPLKGMRTFYTCTASRRCESGQKARQSKNVAGSFWRRPTVTAAQQLKNATRSASRGRTMGDESAPAGRNIGTTQTQKERPTSNSLRSAKGLSFLDKRIKRQDVACSCTRC